MNLDKAVAAGTKNIAEAYELQDLLIRQLYDVTQDLHHRTKIALEFASGGEVTTLKGLLLRHEALGTAIQQFYAARRTGIGRSGSDMPGD